MFFAGADVLTGADFATRETALLFVVEFFAEGDFLEVGFLCAMVSSLSYQHFAPHKALLKDLRKC
jgi:hypothetical protein